MPSWQVIPQVTLQLDAYISTRPFGRVTQDIDQQEFLLLPGT